jgi:ribulose-5-phosphate 4-epimerase/fuculose-1-phosphate aldolase
MVSNNESLEELRKKAVQAHHILTMTGSMGDTTGHVFVRVPGKNELIARCRNNDDWSPGFMTEAAMHSVDWDGKPTEEMEDWLPPPERYIGIEIMKARPEVNVVIHAHPPAQILCSITGVPIRPIIGIANGTGTQLALGGVPVYPRSVLVASHELGRGMVATMGNRDAVLLAAHGNVICGRTVEEATVRAIALENLARLCWTVETAGKHAPDISWQDVEEILNPQQVAAQQVRLQGGARWTFAYYLRCLEEGRKLIAENGVAQP